jgi:hypothetical protein
MTEELYQIFSFGAIKSSRALNNTTSDSSLTEPTKLSMNKIIKSHKDKNLKKAYFEVKPDDLAGTKALVQVQMDNFVFQDEKSVLVHLRNVDEILDAKLKQDELKYKFDLINHLLAK